MTVDTTQVTPEVTTTQAVIDNNTPQITHEAKIEPEDTNWKAFREARKSDRAAKEAAEKRAAEKEAEIIALKAAMEAAFLRDRPPVDRVGTEAYYTEESEDDRIEKKVSAALAARDAAQERSRAEREQREYPDRLQQTYTDFSSVVSTEHLDYLEYHYPEVAGPLKRLPDGYDKWSDIYRAVKKFVPSINSQKDTAKAMANLDKPKSLSSPGIPSGDAMGSSSAKLSDDRKAANWARMQKALRGLS